MAGIEMTAREYLWHERLLINKVGRLAGKLPLTKRLRGSAQRFVDQMRDDSGRASSSQVPTAPAPSLFIRSPETLEHVPLKGMRRRPLQATDAGSFTRDGRDAGAKLFWAGEVVELLNRTSVTLIETSASKAR